MKLSRMFGTLSAVSGALLLSTLAHGQIQSAQTGGWHETSTWSGGVVPVYTDAVVINPTHTVTLSDARQATSVTVVSNENGNGKLLINGGSLEFPATASGQFFTINPVDGVEVSASSMIIVSETMEFNGNGSLKLLASSATIQINGDAANTTLTVASALTVHGMGQVTGDGTNTDKLQNNGKFIADAVGALVLASSLDEIDDTAGSCGNYQWLVNGASSVLQFDNEATGLEGFFSIARGVLDIHASVSTTGKKKLISGGTVDASGGSWSAGSPDCT